MPVLGAMRRTDAIATPSRHLGLVPAAERRAAAAAAVAGLADLIAASCDLRRLVAWPTARHCGRPWDPPPPG